MAYFELKRLFPYKLNSSDSKVGSSNATYDLDLLGYDQSIPKLAIRIESKNLENSPIESNKESPRSVMPECSQLEGKKVILKTNALSGEKSLIFKQKSGEKIEIPARRCSYLNSTHLDIKENANIPANRLTSISNSNTVIRHKPTILKRKGRLRYRIITNDQRAVPNLIKERSKNVAGDALNVNTAGTKTKEVKRTKQKYSRKTISSTDHNYVKGREKPAIQASNTKLLTDNKTMAERAEKVALNREIVIPLPLMPGISKSIEQMQRVETNVGLVTVIPGTCKTEKPKRHGPPKYEIQKSSQQIEFDSDKTTLNVFSTGTKNEESDLIDEQIVESNINEYEDVLRGCKSCKKKVVMQDQCTQTNEEPQKQDNETNTEDKLLDDLIKKKIEATNICPSASPFIFINDPLELNNDICDLILDANLRNDSFLEQSANIDPMSLPYDELLYGRSNAPNNILDISNMADNKVIANYSSNCNRVNNVNHYNENWRMHFFLDLKRCNQFYSSGNLPLHLGVMEDNLAFVKRQCWVMKFRKVHVDTPNQNHMTALQLAVINDVGVEILRVLGDYGADTSITDSDGNNLLHLGVIYSSEPIIKFILLSPRFDINAANFEGYTALILCVLYKKYAKAEILLSAGADPNIGDKKSGRTPLFHAVEANDVDMVKLLINYKAHTKVKNYFGTSPHDAMFELDSIDAAIRRIILSKEDFAMKQQRGRRGRKRKAEPNT